METQEFLDAFVPAVREEFGSRIWFIGLQGSRARGEHTENSDIDLVVVLDVLSPPDIAKYRAVLDGIPGSELACGFLSGRDELLSWDPSDLVQFCQDTHPLFGTLDEVWQRADSAAVQQAVLAGACSIYHGCVHNMLYARSEKILASLLKSASFTMRAEVFLKTGRFPAAAADLFRAASPEEQALLDWFESSRAGETLPFSKVSDALFSWAGARIRMYGPRHELRAADMNREL